ncbi:DUF2255 family protein [Microbispora sp. NEAU-D428]|uniref:DUF2255 family protein n=1 Tax=Microbispora sitophila TaxID=2771537 RepID=UPI001866E190|nr:DUF2255 family protein [Microbispora sitophila]MBE3012095.1 DUF2255 family protein [Microbispora sitophila]
MTTWTADELERIGTADELDIAPQRSDGSLRKPTTIWVVRDGEELFVRSWRGSGGAWYRTACASHAGRVSAGGVTKNVALAEESDPAVNDRIDAAYRRKYGRYSTYVEPMVAATARATTLKLLPR